jgi:hypothetical protein
LSFAEALQTPVPALGTGCLIGPSLSNRRRTLGAVDADRALKKLFKLRARDLLPVTGDRGAQVVSGQIPELNAVTRRLDFVLKLKRGSEVYLRHLEFEMRYRKGLALRVFEYAAGLAAEHGLPVASTAIILKPPAPPTLVHEERIGGQVECRRRIRVVRLWQMDPAAAMRLGLGGAALVGLMGRRNLRVVEAAARRIKAESPPRQYRDLWAVLRMLSEGRYTPRELERVVPKEVVMSSSLVAEVKRRSRAEGRAEGRVEGRAEGEVVVARLICVDFVKQHHPAILSIVAPAIGTCPDPGRLHDWALAAPRVSDTEFVRLVTAEPPAESPEPTASGSSRGRAPRPSRRAGSTRRR